MKFLPIFHLCTSSGPSTSRCERTWVYHLASGVSWLKPSAPWSWIAVSITLCTMWAWKILAIEFSWRMSRPFSAFVGDVQQQQAADVEFAGAVGQHELDGLAVGEQLAEGRTLG